jgi:hypothetical protein
MQLGQKITKIAIALQPHGILTCCLKIWIVHEKSHHMMSSVSSKYNIFLSQHQETSPCLTSKSMQTPSKHLLTGVAEATRCSMATNNVLKCYRCNIVTS